MLNPRRASDLPRLLLIATVAALTLMPLDAAQAFRGAEVDGFGFIRWDAAPRTVSGLERSLAGGLRFSISGGNYTAFRDSFTWSGTPPSVAAFQAAVEKAVAAWESQDPATGLETSIYFVEDFGTAVVQDPPANPADPLDYLGVNLGSEIDIIANNDALDFDPGDPGMRGNSYNFVDGTAANDLTLTSGASGYAGLANSGVDIIMNNDPSAQWTLDWFQLILTHELGHALNMTDVDVFPGPSGVNSAFIDDNYDGSNSAAALATLTNSFATLVDVSDPDNSASLSGFVVPDADPGIDTPGVDILMETDIPSALLNIDVPLQNDDYAGRQFLYPFGTAIPAPALGSPGLLLLIGAMLAILHRRLRSVKA